MFYNWRRSSSVTNREAYEKAAGMNLNDLFFKLYNIDPDEEWKSGTQEETDEINDTGRISSQI